MSPLSVMIVVYLAWAAATYLLEGLPQTLLRPEATGLRVLYAVVANLIVGIGGSGLMLAQACASPHDADQRVRAVLTVSAAEVIICWALTTATIAAARPSISVGRARPLALAPASVLFGLYHVAHSAPFNTPGMIVLLTGVGLLTGTFYLCTGEIIGTLVFHNFLALFGVLDVLDRSGRTPVYQHVQLPLVLTAAAALAVIVTVARTLKQLERSGASATIIRRRRA